jgi:hypothetical protein
VTAVPTLPAVESYDERVRAALAQRRALAQAATPGRWHIAKSGSIDAGKYDTVLMGGPVDCGRYCQGGTSTLEWGQPGDAAFVAANDPAHVLALLDQQETAVGLATEGLRRHSAETNVYGETVCPQHGTEQAGGEPDEPWPCPDALAWWSVLTGIGTTYGVTAEVGT